MSHIARFHGRAAARRLLPYLLMVATITLVACVLPGARALADGPGRHRREGVSARDQSGRLTPTLGMLSFLAS